MWHTLFSISNPRDQRIFTRETSAQQYIGGKLTTSAPHSPTLSLILVPQQKLHRPKAETQHCQGKFGQLQGSTQLHTIAEWQIWTSEGSENIKPYQLLALKLLQCYYGIRCGLLSTYFIRHSTPCITNLGPHTLEAGTVTPAFTHRNQRSKGLQNLTRA